LDKIGGILLIAILTIVSIISITYYILSQPSQTQNNHSPTPTPSPSLKPTASPSEIPTDIDSIPTPSIPEFTVEFADYSYYVPPIYGTDPYTGESVIVEDGYHKDERTIEITVKNQLVPTTTMRLANYTNLYYGVRLKGHYEDDWSEAPKPYYYGYHNASVSYYTIIKLRVTDSRNGIANVHAGGEVDIQVQALIGQDIRIPTMTPWGESCYYKFIGKTSGWSNTQTIEIL
jgi:hypothetical protein